MQGRLGSRALARVRGAVALGLIAAACAAWAPEARTTSPRFYPDDPIQYEPSSQDASGVQPWEIDLTYDIVLNLFGRPGDPADGVRAQNVNTVDEVPDGPWFQNRLGRETLTVEDITRGPNTTNGPAPGTWTVIAAKTDGVTPGFTIRDPAGIVWFLKFDPPGYRGMATGTEAAVTKLVWALGYHVPENHVAQLDPNRLVIDPGATYQPPGRNRRPMKRTDIENLLDRAERDPDGTYRVIASRALAGKPLGGFRFHGTRPDDPNDVVPHEHRRELRGLGVFAAWLNHVDTKSGNSLDTLITENGRSYVQHHLIDFGSTLGSAAVHPRPYWEGNQYLEEPRLTGKGIVGLGFYLKPWRTMPVAERTSIGRLPADHSTWDPRAWKPRVPNAAFLRARDDDRFWAARRLALMTNDFIAAAIRTGRFGDEEGEAILYNALVDRRDAILRAYLPAVNPIVDPVLEGGRLRFHNAAVDARVSAAPAGYKALWQRFDNATGEVSPIRETTASGTELPAPNNLPSADGAYVRVDVSAMGGPDAWAQPVQLYFRRANGGWQLVGLYR
ncbi:MAG TPA: hypothetical protein VNK41_08910 [Vicinamibacterales bacterium]|nr:hypothetical protein [Vicinamibacterales bacterium]